MTGNTLSLKFSALINDPQAVHRVTQTAFTYTWAITVDNSGQLAQNDHIFIAGSEYIIQTAPAANSFQIKPANPNATYADAVAENGALAQGTLVVRTAAPAQTAKFQSGTVTPGTWTITLDAVANMAAGDHVSIDGA